MISDHEEWRITRAMEVCESAGPLACGLRQCMMRKPCGLANEIHDAMLDAEQRVERAAAELGSLRGRLRDIIGVSSPCEDITINCGELRDLLEGDQA